MGRRSFGSTRKLPSGRYQARYYSPDGRRHSSPSTFVTKADANRWLAKIETEISSGRWQDPTTSGLTLAQYADAWLAQRTVRGKPLAPRTVQTYRYGLDHYIGPKLGRYKLSSLTPAVVRTWHSELLQAHGSTPARQSYALLRAILNTAVADDALARNPCRITGAGQPSSPERPLLDVDAVYAIADQMPAHLRAAVLTAFWAHLRIGELVALQRRDIDLDAGTLRVQRQHIEKVGDGPVETEPKVSSKRTIHLPAQVLSVLADHLGNVSRLPAAPLFTRRDGTQLRAHHIQRAWQTARVKAGYPTAKIHDLRHAGLTLTAQLGATQAEIMRRGGHSSTRAAAIYQHAAEARDRALAQKLSQVQRL